MTPHDYWKYWPIIGLLFSVLGAMVVVGLGIIMRQLNYLHSALNAIRYSFNVRTVDAVAKALQTYAKSQRYS